LTRIRGEEANKTRQAILDMFPSVDYEVLPFPVADGAKLKHIDNLAERELLPSFVTKSKLLVGRILAHLPIRQLHSGGDNGGVWAMQYLLRQVFCPSLNSMANAFNSGAVPHLSNQLQAMSTQACAAAVSTAVASATIKSDIIAARFPS